MGSHFPNVLHSVLFLLLLPPPPLLSTGDILDYSHAWKPDQPVGKDSGSPPPVTRQDTGEHWHQNRAESECLGAFDLYLILDKSGSVNNNWLNIYLFVEALVRKFKNPSLRMSFIAFSRDAETIMPLTADRNKIQNGLNRLQWVAPGGYTFMQEGFKQANKQIIRASSGGWKPASVIIALTDGTLMKDPFKETKEEADKARSMGAVVYTVGVLNYDKDQMIEVAGTPEHMFGVDKGFKGLQDIMDSLVIKSCLAVTSVNPSSRCLGEPYTLVITGQGFHNAKDPDQVICRFKSKDTTIDEKPLSVDQMSITCPGPNINQPGEGMTVEVSLNNGISFIGNRFNIASTNCMKMKVTPHLRRILMFVGAGLLVLLLLCCCCCWLYRRRSTKEPPSPSPESETANKESPSASQPEREPEEETLLPPPPPPAPPPSQPPPPSPPVNTCPTVIVSCCGCGSGAVEGRYTNFTLVNPQCAQASCGPKICLRPSRKCFRLTQPPPSPRICVQPSREYFSIPQAPCTPSICLRPSTERFPLLQAACTSRMHAQPSLKGLALSSYAQCHQPPARCSKSPSRTLPLLSPLARKSVGTLRHSYPPYPICTGPKTYH